MNEEEKIPTVIYATKVRSGITKHQHVWRKDVDDPAPVPGELPDGDFHFNEGFIKNRDDAKGYVTRFQKFEKLVWLDEIPND